MKVYRVVTGWCSLCLLILICNGKKPEEDKKVLKKKDIRDLTDFEIEQLYDQWEADEEPLEDDELPEHLRTPPPIDMSKIKYDNPEDLMRVTKKGRTLMTFVKVNGNPTRDESEQITKIWQSALWSNHIPCERYMVEDNRAIFLFKDGSQAWDGKDFLVREERLESITIDNKEYKGIYNEVTKQKDEL